MRKKHPKEPLIKTKEPLIKRIIRSNKKEIRFVFLFFLFFVLGQFIHYFSRSYTTPFLVYKLHAGISSKIINIITPSERTFAEGETIGSGNSTLKLAQGCEGVEGLLLVIAAVCAFQAGIRQKIGGILVGSLVIYVANIARIVVLYYTFKYEQSIFEIMHIHVGQTFTIFVGLLFFVAWASKFVSSQ